MTSSNIAAFFARIENASNTIAAFHIAAAPAGNAVAAILGGHMINRYVGFALESVLRWLSIEYL